MLYGGQNEMSVQEKELKSLTAEKTYLEKTHRRKDEELLKVVGDVERTPIRALENEKKFLQV